MKKVMISLMVLLLAASVSFADKPNPGHWADEIGNGTFKGDSNGQGTYNFVRPIMLDHSLGLLLTPGTPLKIGGEIENPFTNTIIVSGNLEATGKICDLSGANCIGGGGAALAFQNGLKKFGNTVELTDECSNNEILKYDTSDGTWKCQNDVSGGGGGVSQGTGIDVAAGPPDVISIEPGYRLPQACGPDQVAKWVAGSWVCSNDLTGGAGSYSAGTGLGLASDTFSILGAYQLPQGCSGNEIPKWDGSGWVCSADNGGPAAGYTASNGIIITPGNDIQLSDLCSDGEFLEYNSAAGWTCTSAGAMAGYWEDDGAGSVSLQDDSGRVALGKDSAALGAKLDVVGNIQSTGIIWSDNMVHASNTVEGNNIQAFNSVEALGQMRSPEYCDLTGGNCITPDGSGDNDWIVTGDDMASGVTGNVGIGISPLYKLHVAGDANANRLCIAGDCKNSWPTGGAGSYSAGTGLSLASDEFSILDPYQLPQGCSNNEIPEWDGSGWVCGVDDSDPSTTYTGSNGVRITPTNDIQLTDLCGDGQILYYDASTSTWRCKDEAGNTYTAGQGLTLSPGNEFRVQDCAAANQVLKWDGGSWACAVDNGGPVGGYTASNGIIITGNDIQLTGACSADQVLAYDGSTWGCVDMGGSASSQWEVSSSDTISLQDDTKNVGVGVDDATDKLEVAGNIKSSGTICDGSGNCIENYIDGDGLVLEGGNTFRIIDCANGKILKKVAGVWSCEDDQGGAGTMDTDWTEEVSTGNVYRENGNVGIGTSSPDDKLDVAGTIEASTILSLNNLGAVGNIVGQQDIEAWQDISAGNNIHADGSIDADGTVCDGFGNCLDSISGYWDKLGSDIYYDGGDVGIGTNSPAYKLHVQGTMHATSKMSTAWDFQAGGDADIGGNLDVAGGVLVGGDVIVDRDISAGRNILADDNIAAGGTVCDGSGNCLHTVGGGGSSLWDDNGNDIYYNKGNVGIGEINPSEKLDIKAGNIGLDLTKRIGHLPSTENFNFDGDELGAYSLGWYWDSWSAGGPTAYLSGWGGIKLFTWNSVRLAINSLGDVGIGTENPTEKLHVEGNATVSQDLNVNGVIKNDAGDVIIQLG